MLESRAPGLAYTSGAMGTTDLERGQWTPASFAGELPGATAPTSRLGSRAPTFGTWARPNSWGASAPTQVPDPPRLYSYTVLHVGKSGYGPYHTLISVFFG